MSCLLAHIWQAQRNRRLAQQLFNEHEYREWVVTVTFYSALHFVEAAFSQNPTIGHSETSIPLDYPGGLYGYREDLVLRNYTNIYKAYSKLRNNSMVARYLSNRRIPLDMLAEEYFDTIAVNGFLNNDLDKVCRKLGF